MLAQSPDPDLAYLSLACELAVASARADGGPFAAVVVRDGEVVATGVNRVTASGDPTAHAEITALRTAAAALGTHELSGCVLYASCQPCPMCLTAAWWARVDRVVFAATAAEATAAGFDDARLWAAICDPSQAPVPPEHRPLRAASEPFRAWAANPGRIPY